MSKKVDNKSNIRALFVPSTLDTEKRTVDVTFATDTPVLRYSWMREEYYNEILDMNGADLSRASKGLPVLNNHATWGSVGETVIGRAENIRKENDTWAATIRFSSRDNVQGLINDIREGIITDVSFGYSVNKVERMDKKDNEQYRNYMVRSWTPTEISFVTIPADPRAGVRSAEGNDYDAESFIEPENSLSQNQNQSRAMDKPNPEPTAAERAAQEAKVRQEAVASERKRVADISDAVRKAKLKDEFAQQLIANGTSIEEARQLIIDEFAKQDPHQERGAGATVGKDREREHMRGAMADAILLRGDQTVAKEVKDSNDRMKAAHEFRGYSMLEMARLCLEKAGENTRGLSKTELAARSFHSTSDFPVILENVTHKTLLAAYTSIPDVWSQFCATGSVSDFRPHHRYRTGSLGNLEVVLENGEYKNMPIADGTKETISAKTLGRIISISREMLINDDMGAFQRLAGDLGRSAARTIELAVFSLLAENSGLGPNLNDGKTLFHADHGNIGTGAAISVDSIDADKVLMASQKEPNGNDYLSIRPYLLLVPIGLESKAMIYNQSQYNPDASNKLQLPNAVVGLFRQVVGTPRLSGTRRYTFADPQVEPVIEVAFLDGNQSPYMEMQQEFRTDGISWKVRHDFGVGAIGFRGAVTNAGQ